MLSSQRELGVKEEVARAPVMLPSDRHKNIMKLSGLSGLAAGERTVLQKLIQEAETEEKLAPELRENAGAVSVLCKCISITVNLDQVAPLLELLLLALKASPSFSRSFSDFALDQESQSDPGLRLQTWAEDETGKVVFRAMEVFAHIISGSNAKYQDKWLGTIVTVIRAKLDKARQASETSAAACIKPAEAAVCALCILSRPIDLRSKLLKPTASGLSAPALLPTLLFPGENSFASAVEDHTQFVYDATRSIWQLTFNGDHLMDLDSQCRPDQDTSNHSIITVLNNLLKKQKKEKCIRMALLVLSNYVRQHKELRPTSAHRGPNYIKDMIGVGMVQNLEMLQKRTFGDEDILPDIQTLLELLEDNVEDLSSYAMYKQEVASGVLEWSPPHTSEKFWRENVKAFEADSFQPIKELANIIKTSKKVLNIQIACHDMGEFVRHHPQGKWLWGRLKIKERIYELIENGAGSDSDKENVKKHALICMQKIMVQRWEFL
ncbi:V-type proton ATPase subunit H [Diplonema papillatum]|nr:V-type proton ATPase subunit H [Diplonema papillatum]